MPDIKTPALERCIGRMGEYGPDCLDGLCARKGECQYPDDCPSPRAVADAAIKELTALRARVERGEAGWEAFDRVQRNDWIIATAYDGQNFGYVVNTRDGEPRNGSQHFKQEMQTFAPTAREAAVKGLELLSPESSHA